jgi:hypothetical protein
MNHHHSALGLEVGGMKTAVIKGNRQAVSGSGMNLPPQPLKPFNETFPHVQALMKKPCR